jgi:hypothetical protein
MNWYQSNDAKRMFAELRKAKGRPAVRTVYQQFDASKGHTVEMLVPDPILQLKVARERWRSRPFHYGAVRQRVVSPVALPDMRK